MPGTSAPADARLAAVILAAGASTRLGRPKQLLRYRGLTLIERAVRLARSATGFEPIVVLGSERLRLRALLRRRDARLRIVVSRHWTTGLAASLAAGIGAVPPAASAALILVVDQAKLEPRDIDRLVARWRRRPVTAAAAHYLGRPGVPAVIPRRWFRELSALSGDVGARSVLRRLGDISLMDLPGAAFDVDTPADARALGA